MRAVRHSFGAAAVYIAVVTVLAVYWFDPLVDGRDSWLRTWSLELSLLLLVFQASIGFVLPSRWALALVAVPLLAALWADDCHVDYYPGACAEQPVLIGAVLVLGPALTLTGAVGRRGVRSFDEWREWRRSVRTRDRRPDR